MKKLKVIEINEYLYTLEDSDKKTYIRDIEFYDTKVEVGDYIYADEILINETNIYVYGPIIEKNNIEDLIKIVHNDKEIYLQRYYG